VSTVHVVHELCDCDARPERFNEDEQQDQCSGWPEYSSKVKTYQCFRNDLTEGRPRRSLSADFGDINKDRRHTEDSNQHTGMFIPNRRRVDQFVEMPWFDGTGDLQLFPQRWSNSEQLFWLKNSIQIVPVPDGKAGRV